MPPPWVRDLHTLWSWVESEINGSGGRLAARAWPSPEIYPEDTDDWLTISFDELIVYLDGTYLTVELTIDWQMNAVFYEYHYGNIGGSTIWRLCRNQHRTAEYGEIHLHLGETRIIAANEADLDQVFDCIRDNQIPGI